MIVDREPPDISIKHDRKSSRKSLCRWGRRHDRRRARGVSRRERQADYREPAGLHEKGAKKRFASLDDFLKRWKSAERKQAIIEELENEGLSLDPLAEEVGKDLDPFDLICHVAFDQPAANAPRARGQRPQTRCLHQIRPAGTRRA